ncbi:MAG: N-acetylmuramic acid 6-phosphate etherase, partial [Crocinitomicaceae bacterium]
MNRETEKSSNYNDLERMSTLELLTNINREDQTVALAVSNEIPRMEAFVNSAFEKMQVGGR